MVLLGRDVQLHAVGRLFTYIYIDCMRLWGSAFLDVMGRLLDEFVCCECPSNLLLRFTHIALPADSSTLGSGVPVGATFDSSDWYSC